MQPGQIITAQIDYDAAEQERAAQKFATPAANQNQKPQSGNYERSCRQPQSAEEADLCQQWRMAESTEELVALTDWQITVGYIEIGALVLALGLSAWAARAASRSAAIAEQSLVSIERAFVFAKNAYAVSISDSSHLEDMLKIARVASWRFHIVWENSGSTPTQNMTTYKNLLTFPGEMPDDFLFPDIIRKGQQKKVPRTFVGPRAIKDAGGIPVPVDVLEKVKAGELRAYMWGWAEYGSIFRPNEPSRSEFCFEIIVDGDLTKPSNGSPAPFVFRQYHKHNGSGEECFRQAGQPIPVQEVG